MMLLAGLEPGSSVVADAGADRAIELATAAKPGRRVVLIGASIGREWDLPDFEGRMHLRGYSLMTGSANSHGDRICRCSTWSGHCAPMTRKDIFETSLPMMSGRI